MINEYKHRRVVFAKLMIFENEAIRIVKQVMRKPNKYNSCSDSYFSIIEKRTVAGGVLAVCDSELLALDSSSMEIGEAWSVCKLA